MTKQLSRARMSPVHSALTAAMMATPLVLTPAQITAAAVDELSKIGMAMDAGFVHQAVHDLLSGTNAVGLDDSVGLQTAASIATPIQFLQSWLPGFVRVITKARKIDELIGMMTIGSWEDEEIIQGVLEPVGEARLYGDYTNVPLSSWNPNYERRTVIRFEQGIQVGLLAEARAARVRINDAAEKRNSAALALEISRNRIGFVGFNGGANRTYGYLNDPSLPAYVTAAATGTGSSTLWSAKTFLNIVADIRGMAARLQAASGDTWNPEDEVAVLGLGTSVYQYLSVVSDFGISVRQWIKETYPKWRIVSAPELDAANGGANVAYLHPETMADGSTDGGQVWKQLVPAKFKALGTERKAKGYLEDFSNATAGVMLARPFLVQRLTGI